MRAKAGSPELEVARIAARQHGVVTVRQLLVAGLSRDAVRRRVQKGVLHREHRGVYRVGHRAPSTEAHYLAATLSLDALARACHEAQVRHRITGQMVENVLARRPRVTGAGKLREIFHGHARITLSKLERDFLSVLQSAGLPLPETNRLASDRYVDCRWPEHRVTVELDSYRYHHTRHAWEQDRRREREARARGDEFRRYTYGDVTEDTSFMLAELRNLLAC